MERRLPSLDAQGIARIRARIHDSIGDLEAWPEALREVARAVGATGVAMTLPSFDARSGYSFDSVVVNVDFECAVTHTRESGTLDPWTVGGMRKGFARPGIIVRGGDMCDMRDVERTSWHSAVYVPANMGDVLTASFAAPPETGCDIALAVFHRHRPCEMFEEEAVERLAQFRDDLALSSKVAFALNAARNRAALLMEALDRVRDAVIMLGPNGVLRHANRAGERLLRAGALITARAGKIAAPGANGRTLAAAIASAEVDLRGSSIALRREGGAPLIANVTPFAPTTRLWGEKCVIVTIDLDDEIAPEETIAKALTLTRAEARLARALAQGLSLREASVLLDHALETSRTQLKSMFAKLSVARQAGVVDLVRRVRGG